MTIPLFASSFLFATGMSYGSYAQIHPVDSAPTAPPSLSSSSDPFIQKRNEQRAQQAREAARVRAENAALLATKLRQHAAHTARAPERRAKANAFQTMPQ